MNFIRRLIEANFIYQTNQVFFNQVLNLAANYDYEIYEKNNISAE